jgi:hypothetical protein
VDARLQAGLRADLATYQDELVAADADAAQLARNLAFQRALIRHDRGAIQRLLKGHPNLSVEAGKGFQVGRVDPTAATRQVAVVGERGTRGAVIAAVPLDQSLVSRLEGRSGLDADEHVLLLARRKAADVAQRLAAEDPGFDGIVIGGDSMYMLDQLLGKAALPPRPEDAHNFRRSLQELKLFHSQFPDAVITPGHDPDFYDRVQPRYE